MFDTTTDITVYPQPVLDSIAPYNPFYEICEGDSVVLVFTAQSSLLGYSEWQYMGTTYQQDNLSVAFTSPGMFPISVVAWANGCASPQQQTVVTIARCPELLFYIPNSFTPDGNEHNQTWLPVFTNGFDPYDYHIQVFNRWGELVFESRDHTEGWDGTYALRPAQDGAYTYQVSFGDKQTDYRQHVFGHFGLIR
jgi:gliding motility-associated-like protein